MDRRQVLMGLAGVGAAAGARPVLAGPAKAGTPSGPAEHSVQAGTEPALPAGAHVPRFKLFYECEVTLAPIEDFGATNAGHRRVIPITGGHFQGPAIRGTVVPGGADWNLQRGDGGSSVEAAYYLRTDDGVTIRIVNTGVGGGAAQPAEEGAERDERFFMYTHPVFEAPAGKYDWINRAMFIGTLGARKDMHDAVLIRVFQVI